MAGVYAYTSGFFNQKLIILIYNQQLYINKSKYYEVRTLMILVL